MPYADSDFFIALLKEGDWLGTKAESVFKRYKGRIWTSKWTMVEILMLSKEFSLDPENVVISIIQIADVEGGVEELMSAAHLIKEKGMKTFDALHAVSCKGDKMISSDSIFDKIGVERIKLEER